MKKEILDLIAKLDSPEITSIVLVGSWARAQALKHSDIDILRFTEANLIDKGSQLIADKLVNVSNIKQSEVEKWFTQPEIAVGIIAGIRAAKILKDKNNYFANIQKRAGDFVWDETMQAKANIWASKDLVGWVEEVNKGLNGLKHNDAGRLLQARFGLSWGLSKTIQVQKGILISSDNAFYEEIHADMAEHEKWVELREKAFGINTPLAKAVEVGLLLYVETASLLEPILQKQDRALIQFTVNEIKKELNLLA